MKLSIVTTMYYSAPYIKEFYERLSKSADKITYDYEIIFVNDGSPDNSLDVVLELRNNDKKIKIIDLSRNFGHHKAIMTGLAHAKGELIFLIDCDLEEEPELLTNFNKVLKEKSVDVVYGIQEKRKGKWFEKISGYIFYKLFNAISNYPMSNNPVTARLMSKRYVNNLVEHKDVEIFLAGLWAITGFDQFAIPIEKHNKNSTTYTTRKKISVLVNSITSFSIKPLIYIFYLGFFISFSAFIGVIVLIVRKILFSTFLSGWPSLIASIWLMGGFTIISIGILGIYISKIFMEVKRRPYTIIRHIYGHDNGQ